MIRMLVYGMFVAMAGVGVCWPCPAAAAPDKPSISTDGKTATFTGDQHLGITNLLLPPPGVQDFTTPGIYNVNVNNLTQNIMPAFPYSAGIYMGFTGAGGKDGDGGYAWKGDNGTSGTAGANLALNYDGGTFRILPSTGNNITGIFLTSKGGGGGDGGSGWTILGSSQGGDGAAGASGGVLTVTSNGAIQAITGIQALSTGGGGGNGGKGDSGSYGAGGNGGKGGAGNTVTVTSSSTITSTGYGIYAQSLGGDGGAGGNGGGTYGEGGNGGNGGAGGQVTVTSNGGITTQGTKAHGVYALSQAGQGSKGGEGDGAGGQGGDGGIGGTGGAATVTNHAGITTSGGQSQGILAQSLGGAGGDGGSGKGLVGIGGAGKGSGPGGQVSVTNSGVIQTAGDTARGIFAQSVGGFAGSGGSSGGLFAYGANGNSGGAGGGVTVTNTGNVTTSGKDSDGLLVQSVGGGGGSGGSAGGLVTIGGSGNAGGQGGVVTVSNSGKLQTAKDDASGIFAQSIGGGGGDGGAAISASPLVSVAIGGSAGIGGNGGQVRVDSSNNINTSGVNAPGIHAQSAGGGGGNGGYAISATANPLPSFTCSFSMGGSGGGGGQGGTVDVTSTSIIDTRAENAYGIFAESLGGGGGAGGFSVAASASSGYSAAVSLGGSGGTGGSGQKVAVTSGGDITTSGVNAHAILAQSVGGGGGAAGYSASGSLGVTGSASFSMGGSGGAGGNGGEVDVTNNNKILTSGKMASGLLAQSVGGGGGTGGFSIDASVGVLSGSASLGGKGGTGGSGGLVGVTNSADITTGGEKAYGILAQSVGGGGGAAGYSLSETVGVGAIGFALGGSGTAGGLGGTVNLDNSGDITTKAVGSHGIFAQSVGGGGGAGGWAETTAISFGVQAGDITIPSLSLSVASGGKGGPGSSAQKVSVQNSGDILTDVEGSNGIFAQSIGGGGGDAGWGAAAAMNFSEGKTYGAAISVAHGGTGGSGGNGGQVEVVNEGNTRTTTENSPGILAQSIGGGGGNGGLSVAATVEASNKSTTFQSSVSVGGKGGSGGSASQVNVTSSKSIITAGDTSAGIDAQSIGGGGGNGGLSVAGDLSLRQSIKADVSVGGSGGEGGEGGGVTVNTYGSAISTSGEQSPGVSAQSVGGGGGHGGSSYTLTLGNFGLIGSTRSNVNLFCSVGGKGGSGDLGGAVTVKNLTDSSTGVRAADISTQGTSSYGIYAQSVGGGGGDGGASFSMAMSSEAVSNKDTKGVDVQAGASVGGGGGSGNHGGTVEVDNDGNISTQGESAHGIYAQSIGGGGGNGGKSTMFNYLIGTKLPQNASAGFNFAIDATVGGNGGGSSNGGSVTVKNNGNIETHGNDASGIFAQSIGGGGGNGGSTFRIPGAPIPNGTSIKEYFKKWFNLQKWAVSVGGMAGSSGKGGDVNITNTGDITTTGSDAPPPGSTTDNIALGSHGIFAQSVGGGGGTGGNANIGFDFGRIGLGGTGGAGGDGGLVTVTNSGAISTAGHGSYGIWAQGVGGGGGMAGDIARSALNITNFNYFGLGLGIGLPGGAGGHGGAVTVSSTGDITTQGDGSYGIFAQSVGGGGGTGGEDTGYPEHLIFNGSTFHGANGDGGQVTVSQTGNIVTQGEGAHGIVAQSTSGAGKAGPVNVTLTGNVIAGGYASHGILAQSLGAGSCQNITATINSGSTVKGGCDTGDCAPGGGTNYSFGVLFLDGLSNTLTNNGIISSASGTSGTAVMQQASYGAPARGNLTINNSGTINGSVNQGDQAVTADSQFMIQGMSLPAGSSTISFNNNQGGLFNAGSTINLGTGTLTNSGTMSPGGGAAVQSNLTGNFTQMSTGIFQTTLNSNGSCGSLNVSDIANLNGALALNFGSDPFTASTTYDILTANAVQNEFSQEINPSTLLSVSTNYLPTAVELTVTPQSFTTVAQNSHEMALGQYHDRMLLLADHDFGRVLGKFQTLPASGFKSAFASFSPAVYDANTFTTFSITHQYVRTVHERLSSVRQNVLSRESRLQASTEKPLLASNDSNTSLGSNSSGDCSQRNRLWVSIDGFGNFGDADEADGLNGFDYSMSGMAVDFDYALSDRVVVGGGYGYSDTQIDLDSGFGSGDIDSFHGSLFGTYFVEQAYLEGILAYGSHWYDNSRKIRIGDIQGKTESDHDADAYSGLIEGGYNFSAGNLSMQPFASLFYSYLDGESIQESGAGNLDMHIGSSQTDDLSSDLGLRVSHPIKTSKGILTPVVKAAWQYDYDIDRHSMPVSFAGAPVEMTIKGRERPSSALFGAGLSFTSNCGVIASVEYEGEVAEEYTADSIFGQIKVPF